MKQSCEPNLDILDVPIDNADFCSAFIFRKHVAVKQLLSEEVEAVEPHVAFIILGVCVGFCKLVRLARTTPPLHTMKAFELFDENVRRCFAQCTAVDTSDHAWHQARLSLSRGGLGLAFTRTALPCSLHCLALYLWFWLAVATPPCLSGSVV